MKARPVKSVRCAIYTRVSTEQGLDQDFNSLDAQYEAASAYIKSQAHAGWTLIRSRYDEGVIPAGQPTADLQRLLEDIRARKIDVIVVYKVDRLTRSLADFAKLVELFDSHGASVNRRFPARSDPPACRAGDEGEEMTKTPGAVQPPKQLTKAERDARKAFRQVDAQKAMTEHDRIDGPNSPKGCTMQRLVGHQRRPVGSV